jgi:hypothetical protein
MFRRLRKLSPALLAVPAALALSACGSAHTKVTTGSYAGENGVGAPYLDVGQLIYQVQLSRELNPTDTEDAGYLQGLTPAERALAPGQEWFGVFVQVYNNHSAQFPAASTMTITDTQGNAYTPLPPSPASLYAYRGGPVPANGQLPIADSTASFGPTQGSLLLYKIQLASLDNRPLKIKIANPLDPAETASAELDVCTSGSPAGRLPAPGVQPEPPFRHPRRL